MNRISSSDILRIVLSGIGLTSVCALIYFAGPLIAIGDWRPFENYIVREIAILVVAAAFASVMAVNWTRRKKATARIAEGIAASDKVEDDTDVLKDRMKDALATLKKASGGKSDFLYDLPWYVLIGPPGSGKTTALVNSGLKFPLSRGAPPAAVAGVGGTRYCEWLFTENAVMIDTAGRYTTQDSDAAADKQSWLAFLDLLKTNRPRQPINGVLVAISLEDLMTLPSAEIAAHANAIRARLLELHERLKVDFPVYAVFTKGDLVAGFAEYFANLSDQGRRQVWGATFQTDDKTRNLVGDVPKEFDDLVERLNVDLTDRLQEEPTPSNRVLLYGFPTQIAALKRPVFEFLNQIFEPTRYHANATLRGFYFTSGTQHGTPIDRLIGALAKSFGAEQVGAQAYSGLGKSFFLTDLILKVIIGEAAWVSTDRAAVRRARIIKACLYATVALFAAAMTGLWWTSYTRNRDMIAKTQYAVADYIQQAGPYAHETTIGDRDLHNVLPLLFKLRNLPTGYATRETPTPLLAAMGLSQRERLRTSADQAYHVSLERLFRPRLMFRLEEVLNANKSNPGAIYEALKVYLMIAGSVKTERDLVVGWLRNDWSETLYPGAPNADGRKALEAELVAMLDLQGSDAPLIEPNWALVEECRRILARLNIADRAYQLLKSQARQSIAPDWVASAHGGPDFATVFESATGDNVDTISVPGFYTYAGFQRAFIDKLPTIAEQLQRDNWVLGDVGNLDAIKKQFDSLARDLLDRYSRDFVATWMQALGKLRMRPLNADKPSYTVLNAASAVTSPIRQLLESIREETALTRERGASKNDKDKKDQTPAVLVNQQGKAPGTNIEQAFKALHATVEGDRRPVDGIIGDLTAINQTLLQMATFPNQNPQLAVQLQSQVATFRTDATRFPEPFSRMLIQAASVFERDISTLKAAQLSEQFANVVLPSCRAIAGRYPLVRNAAAEIPPVDFGRVFGTNGFFDQFITQYLQSYLDTSKSPWTWRQDDPVASRFSPTTPRDLWRANQIKLAFFVTGGAVPSVSMMVTPPVLNRPGVNAKLEVNGTVVASPAQSNVTAAPSGVGIQWIAGGGNRSAVTLGSDTPGTSPSVIERSGAWSFFRLLDAGSVSQRPNGAAAGFIVGGIDLQYQIATQTLANPLVLTALREFKCPTTL